MIALERLARQLSSRSVSRIEDADIQARAAVSVVLRSTPESPEVLLIRRASHPEDPWSGQIAFPGGRASEADLDLLETAKRETLEEVGLDLDAAELLGRLDDVQAIARGVRQSMVISPYVFRLREEVTLSPEESEVAEALWTPTAPMISGASSTTFQWRHEDLQIPMPAFKIGDRVVWGLTYRMLKAMFDLWGAER